MKNPKKHYTLSMSVQDNQLKAQTGLTETYSAPHLESLCTQYDIDLSLLVC